MAQPSPVVRTASLSAVVAALVGGTAGHLASRHGGAPIDVLDVHTLRVLDASGQVVVAIHPPSGEMNAVLEILDAQGQPALELSGGVGSPSLVLHGEPGGVGVLLNSGWVAGGGGGSLTFYREDHEADTLLQVLVGGAPKAPVRMMRDLAEGATQIRVDGPLWNALSDLSKSPPTPLPPPEP